MPTSSAVGELGGAAGLLVTARRQALGGAGVATRFPINLLRNQCRTRRPALAFRTPKEKIAPSGGIATVRTLHRPRLGN
jgi:hypothetical protein